MTLLDITFALDRFRGTARGGAAPLVAPSRGRARVLEAAPERTSEDRKTRDAQRGSAAD